MSEKRILPALILAGIAGFAGVHRFYAGRYVTGVVQLVLFMPGAAMLWPDMVGLLRATQNIDELMEWSSHHVIQPLPVLLVAIPSVWAVVDCVILGMMRFRDGGGKRMTRWT
jgi:hypothetical protein